MPMQAGLISFRFNDDGCSHISSFPLCSGRKRERAVCRQHSASGLFIRIESHRLDTFPDLQRNCGFMVSIQLHYMRTVFCHVGEF